MDELLRPCPFCGGAPRIETLTGRALGKSRKAHMVRCDECGIEFANGHDRGEVIKRWNTRPSCNVKRVDYVKADGVTMVQFDCGHVAETSDGRHPAYCPWCGREAVY